MRGCGDSIRAVSPRYVPPSLPHCAAVGGIFNIGKAAAPTLSIVAGGVGSARRVTIDSLVRQRVIVQRRDHMLWMRQPSQIFYADGCLPEALHELRHFAKRAFIVCDMPSKDAGAASVSPASHAPICLTVRDLGFVDRVVSALASDGISCEVFDE